MLDYCIWWAVQERVNGGHMWRRGNQWMTTMSLMDISKKEQANVPLTALVSRPRREARRVPRLLQEGYRSRS